VLPLLGGVAGLVLAGLGEGIVESHNTSELSLVLYLVGIAVFAVSAWPLVPRVLDLAAEPAAAPTGRGWAAGFLGAPGDRPAPAARWRVWLVAGGGAVIALALGLFTAQLVRQKLDDPAAPWWWLASMVAIALTGLAVGRGQGWPARWGQDVGPQSRQGRILLVVALLALLALTLGARLLLLDKVPFGINADEGDRAATAIQIIRGDNTDSIFDYGWYFISMFYFWTLAQVMKIAGISYVGARVFGALAGIIAVAAVTWIGARHFGWRVGVMAGALLSVLAVALQFSRETSEAGPTAMLWAVSAALFLDAARTGRSWAWIGAGMTGGLSLYFYPSGRLWAVLAVLWCAYLFVHGLGGRRLSIVRGIVLAAVAALIVMGPYLSHVTENPQAFQTFTLRANETSIFTNDNPTRLGYYNREWNTLQLIGAQLIHSFGIFNQFHDDGGFWPGDKPITLGWLAVLILLGLGWACTRWRDPRYVMLALWFLVGFSGVIVTVETPNVQRMATAVPVLALFPALVLDSLIRRVDAALPLLPRLGGRLRAGLGAAATGLALLVIGGMMIGQWRAYFVDYAATDRWPQPSYLGWAVNDQGTDTLVLSVGRQFHMVNSGWVRLLAPNTPRGGVQTPGSNLPLALPADRNLAFLLFPRQMYYLPYLSALYPGGETTPYTHPTEGLMFSIYRVPQAAWAAQQGALVTANGATTPVPALGVAPPGWSTYPSAMRWTAALRVPQFWNYSFQIGPGPARLLIDGQPVLTVAPGIPALDAKVSLARGDHQVVYEGTVTTAGQPALFQWAAEGPHEPAQSAPPPEWQPVSTAQLQPRQEPPGGLYGVVRLSDPARAEQRRLDNTLATCCLSDGVHSDGKPYDVTWTGTLLAPVTGVYSMTLFSQGATVLKLDDRPVFQIPAPQDEAVAGAVDLQAGPHPITVTLHVDQGPGGLEWTWTPPGGVQSIVPPSVLIPPPGAGIGPPLTPAQLGKPDQQPTDRPLDVVK
jgi:hypothetical protein